MEPDRDTVPLRCGAYMVLAEMRPLTSWTRRWSRLPHPYKQEVLSLMSVVVEQRISSYLELRRQRKPMQCKQMKELAHSKPVIRAGKHVEVEVYFRKRHVGLRCLSGRLSEGSYVKLSLFPEQLIVCVNAVCDAPLPPPPPPPPPQPPPAAATSVAPLLRPEGVDARSGDRALSQYFNHPSAPQANVKALLTDSAQRRQDRLRHIVKKTVQRKGKDKKSSAHRTEPPIIAEPPHASSDSPRISLTRTRRHDEMKENDENSAQQREASAGTEVRVGRGGCVTRASEVEKVRHTEEPAATAAAAAPQRTCRGPTKLSRKRQRPPTQQVTTVKTHTAE